MSNNVRPKFDLEERTAKFGESVILFSKVLPPSPVLRPLVSQIVRSSTSIGANYCEADSSSTKPEFVHRIGICKKEARETGHWLRMIRAAYPQAAPETVNLQNEAKELHLIFNAIIKNSV